MSDENNVTKSDEATADVVVNAAGGEKKPSLEITTSRQFSAWMAEQGLSVGLTTYQAGKIFLVGLKPDGGLSLEERTLNRCMGMTVQDQGLWVSTLYQIWRYENIVPKGEVHGEYDRIYVPKTSYVTGDCDIHDMAVDADGRLIFVNTLFSCLATTSETHSFQPIWRPDFISQLAAEDRCHMNGLAMVDGHPGFVTMVSRSDVADGWRDRRTDGGSVVSVPNGDIVATGLSMPHSPRYYDGKLWLLNSGTGYFGYIDMDTGKFENVAFCAGYLRGLAFHGDFAIVGLSKPRGNRTFSGLPLDGELAERDADPRCGIQVIDLRSGSVVHWLRIEGVIEELYDVVALPGVQRPTSVGFVTDEIRRVISIAPEAESG
jgi:uncharacterized protein (TIGR03032 family)